MGYPGAIYKSFGTEAEAKEYLGIRQEAGISGASGSGVGSVVAANGMQADSNAADAVEIYVDGSYHAGTKEFSYGMVVLIDGREEKFSQKMSDPELAQMRNVAGEIKGSEAAMQYALDHKIPRHHRRSCHQKAQKNRTENHRPYYFFPKILHRSNLPADNRCHMLQTELLQK